MRRVPVRKILVRAVVTLVAIGIAFVAVSFAFDDLDASEIWDALRSLNDAEWLALACAWTVWLATQGLQTAALIPRLPVRRGVLAFLAPAAIAAVVPGPSDLPLRHQMLRSWGYPGAQVTIALAAAGVFSIGVKLVLPVLAAVGIVLSGAPIDDTWRTVLTIVLLVGVVLALSGFALSSEPRTERAARIVEPVVRLGARLWPGADPEVTEELPEKVVERRAEALTAIRGRGRITVWATALAATTRFVLLLLSLRFLGVPEDVLPWQQVFVAYALVSGLTVLPITPGDVGVSEAAYIALLGAATGGDLVNEITAAVLVFRLLTWLLVIPAGLVSLAIWRRSVRGARSGRGSSPMVARSGDAAP